MKRMEVLTANDTFSVIVNVHGSVKRRTSKFLKGLSEKSPVLPGLFFIYWTLGWYKIFKWWGGVNRTILQ